MKIINENIEKFQPPFQLTKKNKILIKCQDIKLEDISENEKTKEIIDFFIKHINEVSELSYIPENLFNLEQYISVLKRINKNNKLSFNEIYNIPFFIKNDIKFFDEILKIYKETNIDNTFINEEYNNYNKDDFIKFINGIYEQISIIEEYNNQYKSNTETSNIYINQVEKLCNEYFILPEQRKIIFNIFNNIKDDNIKSDNNNENLEFKDDFLEFQEIHPRKKSVLYDNISYLFIFNKMINIFVTLQPKLFKYLPENFKTAKLYESIIIHQKNILNTETLKILAQNKDYIYEIPKHLLSKEIIINSLQYHHEALNNNEFNVKGVSYESNLIKELNIEIEPEILFKLLKHNFINNNDNINYYEKLNYLENIFSHIPKSYLKHYEQYSEILDINSDLINKFPVEFITYEMLLKASKKNANLFYRNNSGCTGFFKIYEKIIYDIKNKYNIEIKESKLYEYKEYLFNKLIFENPDDEMIKSYLEEFIKVYFTYDLCFELIKNNQYYLQFYQHSFKIQNYQHYLKSYPEFIPYLNNYDFCLELVKNNNKNIAAINYYSPFFTDRIIEELNLS